MLGIGERLARRGGAGGEKELVVGLGVLAAGTANGHGLLRAIDGYGLATSADIDAEPGRELGGWHDGKPRAVADDAPDVVWKTAVGVGDIVALFKEDDLGVFVEAAKSGRSTGAGSDASDDDGFHGRAFYGKPRRNV